MHVVGKSRELFARRRRSMSATSKIQQNSLIREKFPPSSGLSKIYFNNAEEITESSNVPSHYVIQGESTSSKIL